MAKWELYEKNSSAKKLQYRSDSTGLVHDCGMLRHDTPDLMVVQWVIEQEATRPGDFITLPGGGVLQVLPSPQAQA